MKISKLAVIPLSTLLICGCDILSHSSTSDDTEVETGTEVETSTEDDTSSGQSVLLVDDDAADNDAELRVSLGDAYSQGKVSVNVMYASDEVETAYISLYGESASSSYLAADIKLDESYASTDGSVGVQLRDDVTYGDSTLAEFDSDTWTNISVEWDSAAGTQGQYTVLIAGVDYGTFDMPITDDIEYIAIKIGSKSNVTYSDTPLYIDDLMIYSDTDGTTEIVADDFDSYTVGVDLTGTGNYSSSGYNAVVSDTENATDESDSDDDASGQSVLLIDDDAADNDAELRVDLGGAYEIGTVSVNVMYAADEDQTAYITLYGESASSSYLVADVLMDESYKIDSDVGARLRDDAIYDDTTLDEFAAATWTNITVDWDITAGTQGQYSVSIGGDEFGPFDMSISDDVEYIAFKIGSKSNVTSSATPLYLDDIVITSGETSVFSDDFESYTDGEDLTGTGSYSGSGYGAIVSDDENTTSIE